VSLHNDGCRHADHAHRIRRPELTSHWQPLVPILRQQCSSPSLTDHATSRNRLSLGVLLAMTAAGVTLCAVIVSPFVPGLVWALALVVAAGPFHRWMFNRLPHPNLAAGIAVAVVALGLLIPALLVGWQVGQQATDRIDEIAEQLESGMWRQRLERIPALKKAYDWFGNGQDPVDQAQQLVPEVQRQAGLWLQSAAWATLQIFLALFTLFFLFRDRDRVEVTLRSLMPMSERETDYFFDRISSMTHATIYGTVVVAMIQGGLGGLMFAFVGIPGALLWGVVMAILSMVPTAGAFLIWLPTAVVLGLQGEWGKAALIGAWGALVVGTIDNFLYPALVGKEMRLHTLPVFFAIVGGVAMFGAAGVVLGPVVLAATIALLDILRQRTARGGSAVAPKHTGLTA
jgi:predicted PurR-regulated permease PerM